MALKWLLWLSHGIFHAPARAGINGLRDYVELANKFVLLRQRDMVELFRSWKQATIITRAKSECRVSRLTQEKEARATTAIRLIRKGTIAMAGRALENKGLGNITNPGILEQLQAKHLERQRKLTKTSSPTRLRSRSRFQRQEFLRN
jgi:hypothetical protein